MQDTTVAANITRLLMITDRTLMHELNMHPIIYQLPLIFFSKSITFAFELAIYTFQRKGTYSMTDQMFE